jgi:hypothetical protein
MEIPNMPQVLEVVIMDLQTMMFKFVATDDLHLITLAVPTGISGYFIDMPKIEIFENSCSGSSIYCNQGTSSLVNNLIVGSTYLIRVYSENNFGGRGHFNICISSPPANLTCGDAQSLIVNANTSCNNIINGSTVGIGNQALWYDFIATNTSHVIDLVIGGNHLDVGINFNVYNNCTIIGDFISNTSDDENKRFNYNNFIIGQTYSFQVYKGSNNEVPFTLCIKEPELNDNCTNASLVSANFNCSCNLSSSFIISSATRSEPNPSTCNPLAMDVWYKFIATSDQSIITVTRNNSSFNGQTTSGISGYIDYTQGCTVSALQCPFGINSTILNGLVAGQEYKFRVAVAYTDTISICIKNLTNDYCSNAKVLTVSGNQSCSSVSGSTINASPSENFVGYCSGLPQNDVWYEFTATSTRHSIKVTPTSAGFNPSFSVLKKNPNNNAQCDQNCVQGPSNQFIIDQCVDNTNIDFQPEVIIIENFIVGTKYLIAVRSGSNLLQNGTFDICVSTPGTAQQIWSTSYSSFAGPTNAGKWRQEIKLLKVTYSGTTAVKNINQIVANLYGTNDVNDILKASLFLPQFLGNVPDLDLEQKVLELAPQLFGNEIVNPSGNLSFVGSTPLNNSVNSIISTYFILAFDVSCDAPANHVFNAEIQSVNIDGVVYTPFHTASQNNNVEIDPLAAYNTIQDGDWSSPSIWLCNTVPPNAPDNPKVIINHLVTVNDTRQTGNIEVKYTKSLTISPSGFLTMGKNSFGSEFGHSNKVMNALYGNLTIDGGNLKVNGSAVIGFRYLSTNIGSFNLINGGTITLDGNDGHASSSGASLLFIGTPILGTDGTGHINILDPGYYALPDLFIPGLDNYGEFRYKGFGTNSIIRNWNLTLGGGDDQLNYEAFPRGFQVNQLSSNLNALIFKNIYVKSGLYNENRHCSGTLLAENINVDTMCYHKGNLYFSGNLINDGEVNAYGIYLGNYLNSTNMSASTLPQSISGKGEFKNFDFNVGYNNSVYSLYINNTNNVNFNVPLNVANSLVLKSGRINTSDTSVLSLGYFYQDTNSFALAKLCTNFGVNNPSPIEFTGSASTWNGGFINGPFRRWFNRNTSPFKRIMPIGKNAIPRLITLKYDNTAPSFVTAEFFNTNPGNDCGVISNEQNLKITNVSPTGFWRVQGENTCGNYEMTFDVSNFSKQGSGLVTDIGNTRIIKRPFDDDWANSCAPQYSSTQTFSNFHYTSSLKPCDNKASMAVVKIHAALSNEKVIWSIRNEVGVYLMSDTVFCNTETFNFPLFNGCYTFVVEKISCNNQPCSLLPDTLATFRIDNELYFFVNAGNVNGGSLRFCLNNGNNALENNTNCLTLNSDFSLGGGNDAMGPALLPLTHYVTTTADNAVGSLRYFIEVASCNDTIRFDPMINNDTIYLLIGLEVEKNIVVIADPSQNITISSLFSDVLFDIGDHETVMMDNLKILEPFFPGTSPIINNKGKLKINNLEVTKNSGSSVSHIINTGAGTITFEGMNYLRQ